MAKAAPPAPTSVRSSVHLRDTRTVDLAAILLRRARQVGVRVRLDTRATVVHTSPEGAELLLQHGGAAAPERYDLVVAADSVGSRIRSAIGVEGEPHHLSLGAWRVMVPRPRGVERLEIITGGPSYFTGYAPMSATSLYAWIVADHRDADHADHAEQVEIVRSLAAGYHGPWEAIAASIGQDTPVSYALQRAAHTGSLAPRKGGAHRRRCARLPAHHGPGGGNGYGGRLGARAGSAGRTH